MSTRRPGWAPLAAGALPLAFLGVLFLYPVVRLLLLSVVEVLVWAAVYRPARPNAERAAVVHVHGGGYRQFSHHGWSSWPTHVSSFSESAKFNISISDYYWYGYSRSHGASPCHRLQKLVTLPKTTRQARRQNNHAQSAKTLAHRFAFR